jgi:hypothetical protein
MPGFREISHMPDYVRHFLPEDQLLIFRFFALFSRWEYALKKSGEFVRRGVFGQAEADWNKYAGRWTVLSCSLNDPAFVAAREYLVTNPPKRLCLENNELCWQPNPRRLDEIDSEYLFRIIRDIRNNLFHGGKYHDGPAEELARDHCLIDSAITVLLTCRDVDPTIGRLLDYEG